MPDQLERLAGALSDRYLIEGELGRGGMATVYLAGDLKHQRKVAIKVLKPELATALGPERFLREIQIAAQLTHPHILALHDSGEAAGFLYYVMPYVEGESLRDRLDRESQLPLDDALLIAGEVADAVGYAHSRGIVHRDIKPENILLSRGHALVADFGIARAIGAAGGAKLTGTGFSIGTPSYMSPEQALGEAVDGRSDIYALGCVLYEMLVGEPPYTGPSAQAIIARRLSEPVPSLRVVREAVPAGVEAAVNKALARTPADRFTTAAQFASALTSSPDAHSATARKVGTADIGPSRRPALLGTALTLLVLAVAGVGIVRWRHSPTLAPDANLIAIAPFDVIDPALEVWREGVVDLLSRTLDGAGSLRTVSASVVVRGWQGRSDRASATALAHRTGAGLAATGTLSRRGADSVELQSALLDVDRAQVLGEVEVVGTTARLGELVDSLGLEILRTLSRDRPVAAVRQASLGSAPLPALKAFLRGEQFYRRSLYDSALVAYSEAIANDSSFALAWYRMGLVLGWNPPTRIAYLEGSVYAAMARIRNHGLPARESLLIAADSAAYAADESHLWHYHDAIARLEEAARRFPADPEVWYALGEAHFHFPYGFGQDYGLALDALDRAITLDPGFGPAYEHVFGLALNAGQPDRARQYAKAGASLEGTDENTPVVRLASRLLLVPTGEGIAGITRRLDSAGRTPLYAAGTEVFGGWPDSNETALQVMRRLASLEHREGETPDPLLDDSLMRLQYVAAALAFRGHLREAYKTNHRLIVEPAASPFSRFLDPFLGLALLGAVPDDIATKAFSPSLEAGVRVRWEDSPPRYLTGLPWWASKRDTAALVLFGRRMSQAASRAERPEDRQKARYLQSAAAAYLALVRGDSATALSRFAALPDTLCAVVSCFYQNLAEAALLAARGQDLHAAEILDYWFARAGNRPITVLARLDRARIAERLHDRGTAIRFYQFVVDAWRRADPELLPYVADAKDGLARLTREPQ